MLRHDDIAFDRQIAALVQQAGLEACGPVEFWTLFGSDHLQGPAPRRWKPFLWNCILASGSTANRYSDSSHGILVRVEQVTRGSSEPQAQALASVLFAWVSLALRKKNWRVRTHEGTRRLDTLLADLAQAWPELAVNRQAVGNREIVTPIPAVAKLCFSVPLPALADRIEKRLGADISAHAPKRSKSAATLAFKAELAMQRSVELVAPARSQAMGL